MTTEISRNCGTFLGSTQRQLRPQTPFGPMQHVVLLGWNDYGGCVSN